MASNDVPTVSSPASVLQEGSLKLVADAEILAPQVSVSSLKRKNWQVFTLSFFNLAAAGCQKLESLESLSDEDKQMFISIIFNIRHGLEVLIKTFMAIINDEKYRIENIHDVESLMEKLQKKITGQKLKKKVKDELSKSLSELENFLTKYTAQEYIKPYLQKENFEILDTQNTLFKYPENSVSIQIDYSEVLAQFTLVDLKNITSDILSLITLVKSMNNLDLLKNN